MPVGLPAPARPAWWREIALGLSVFGLYIIVAVLSRGRTGIAREHGRAVLAFEEWLRLDFEAAANTWLARQPTFWQNLVNYEYAFGYVLVAFGVLFWIWIRRPQVYPAARTSFILVNLIGIACFLLVPVAPPRLLADPRFVDTVLQGHTQGSWGSALVSEANQVAAMPSLHVAWALWACVALVRVGARRRSHVFSAAHVLVTAIVIVVTANHYWLDAVAGVAVVWLADRWWRARSRHIPAEDAFFLHVESPAVPQQVGGVAIFDASAVSTPISRDDLVAVVTERLLPRPALRRVLEPGGWLARPRWGRASSVDLDWHVTEVVLPEPGGEAALRRFIASLIETQLPRDRPLWRVWLVHGVGPHRKAVIGLLHHVLGDGIDVIAHLRALFSPPAAPLPPPAGPSGPGTVKRAVGTAVGLVQLAADGSAPRSLPAGAVTSARHYLTITLPLDRVRAGARARRVRVSDLLLAAVTGALSRVEPGGGEPWPGPSLRASVTMLLGPVVTSASSSNRTATLMVDVPVRDMPATERLAAIARTAERRRRTGRPLASRFVMKRVAAVLPPGLQAAFARSVYRGRYFEAVVSNMPGPAEQLAFRDAPLRDVYPILPLADEVPLAVGALSWGGGLNLGITAAASVLPDGEAFAAALRAELAELLTPDQPGRSDRAAVPHGAG